MKRLLLVQAALLCGLSLFAKDPFEGGLVGMYAFRMDGKQIASENASLRMIPASCTKLVTTGTALLTLGPEYRFKTVLGYSGEIRDSVLLGNLYIIGGGDPSTGGNTSFLYWKSILVSAGIKRIGGDIIGDGRFLSGRGYHPSWQHEDTDSDYGIPSYGLNFERNLLDLSIANGSTEGDSGIVFSVQPKAPWMKIDAGFTAGPKGSRRNLSVSTTELAPVAGLYGTLPIERESATVHIPNYYSALTCAYHFRNFLKENGIIVEGGYEEVRQGITAEEDVKELGTSCSDPLCDLIRHCNYHSDNFYAETIFRTMARTMRGSSSFSAAEAVRDSVLTALGLDAGEVKLVDGSGLSRKNYVSPLFMVNFLLAMSRTPEYEMFLNSLPRPGEGTLKRQMQKAGKKVKERIRMKSGSMNGVRCFGGYILPSDENAEHTIVFCIMTNNMTAPSREVNLRLDEIILSWCEKN